MSIYNLYLNNAAVRACVKTVAFLLLVFAAIFCTSATFGLSKMLYKALAAGNSVGLMESITHSGTTFLFLLLACLGGYLAKKCY